MVDLFALLALAGCVNAILKNRLCCIDSTLKPSAPTVSPISYIDASFTKYDHITPIVDGRPFFLNGIPLRADKLQDQWGLSDDAVKAIYQRVADDGFSHVISEISWLDIQPDAAVNTTKAIYIRGGTSAAKSLDGSSSIKIGYKRGNESNQMLSYVQFNFTSCTVVIEILGRLGVRATSGKELAISKKHTF